MTTTQTPHGHGSASTARCGCCGQIRESDRLTELGDTPGVYICVGCALWAARRTAGVIDIPRLARVSWERFRARRQTSMARSVIPILPSADLEVTEMFYALLGFEVAGRYDGYLVLHEGPVELHFSSPPAAHQSRDAPGDLADGPAAEAAGQAAGGPAGGSVPGTCFVHVQDAVRYWKQLGERDVSGMQPPETQDYGLIEFVVADPFGNRVRFGSPAR
jgi:hypothetical protein